MKIMKDGIVLRDITEDDLALLLELNNDPEINKTTVGHAKKVTMQQQIEWYKRLGSKNDIRLIIEVNNKSVGTCIINAIDKENNKCSIGIKINKRNQGMGIGTSVIRIIVDYIFNELKFHRIYVHILEENLASRKLFEKNGFELEGKEIDSVYKNGRYHNLLTMGLINKK